MLAIYYAQQSKVADIKQGCFDFVSKCYDNADVVWTDYLNKALLDIYYAQQSKVTEIQKGCFDFVS